MLMRHMSEHLAAEGNTGTADQLAARAVEAERRADLVRRAVLNSDAMEEERENPA